VAGFSKKDGPDKVQARINEISKWLRENYPEIRSEQKHIESGTSERGYYMYGYMMALIDIIEVLKRLGIKWKLD
jgi:hypothetical protein